MTFLRCQAPCPRPKSARAEPTPPANAESAVIVRTAEQAAVVAIAPGVVPSSRTPSATPHVLDRAEIRAAQSTERVAGNRRFGCGRRRHDEHERDNPSCSERPLSDHTCAAPVRMLHDLAPPLP